MGLLNEDDDNFESLYAMHVLTAVISGIGCLLFFRLYSDAIKQPEFFAGVALPLDVAAVGAYFYCQLAVNFVVFVTYVDTRCKHHNMVGRQPRRLHGPGFLRARRRGGRTRAAGTARRRRAPRATRVPSLCARCGGRKRGPPFRAPRPGWAIPGGAKYSRGGFQFFL